MRYLHVFAAAFCVAFVSCSENHGAELLGNACMPENIPSSDNGQGFSPSETYLESATECGTHPCLVNRLDNGTSGAIPADPSNVCDADHSKPGCVDADELERAVHCSCRCGGADPHANYCTCPHDFVCREVPIPGALSNWYCVRPSN